MQVYHVPNFEEPGSVMAIVIVFYLYLGKSYCVFCVYPERSVSVQFSWLIRRLPVIREQVYRFFCPKAVDDFVRA